MTWTTIVTDSSAAASMSGSGQGWRWMLVLLPRRLQTSSVTWGAIGASNRTRIERVSRQTSGVTLRAARASFMELRSFISSATAVFHENDSRSCPTLMIAWWARRRSPALAESSTLLARYSALPRRQTSTMKR
ncbi:MAG: hypothetical protein J4G11_03760 [Acidimicrobiia bacterium]|nr:hypothetical protein [Acidimicrobiia bacterium]